MVYVQYYQYGAVSGDLIESCGDRSIVILDGRNSLNTMIFDSNYYNDNQSRHYPAFKLFKGDTFTRSSPISDLYLTKYNIK